MSAWGSLTDAIETALTAGGYSVSTLADAASLPSHTAGVEVVVTVSGATDGARSSGYAADTLGVRVSAIATAHTQQQAQRAGLELCRALRVVVENSATLRASGTVVYRDSSVTMRSGSTVCDASVVFDAFILNAY
jgi:hypothetical protein